MFATGFSSFLVVWTVVLVVVYGFAGRFVGMTLFFAATATLYVLLPFFFFPGDADLLGLLVSTVVLGVLGFHVGLTAFSGFSERNLMSRQPVKADVTHIGCTAAIVLVFSLLILFITDPSFVIEVATYEGRIAYKAREHLIKGVHNQAIVSAAILIIWAYHRKRYSLSLILSACEIAWAVYSSDKVSLLALSAAWLSILLVATWQRRIHPAATLAIIGAVLPASLLFMVFYSVLRVGMTDFALILEVYNENLGRLGAGGANVGDFGGPYLVLTEHLRDEFLDLTLGATYVEQLAILLPKIVRGEFADLAVDFAVRKLGTDYQPGFGFGFSPWAEAYMNFRVAGFFIQGMLFGLLTRGLLGCSIRLMGFNEVTIFFQIVLVTLFERSIMAGQLKATIIYLLPFAATYLALLLLTRSLDRRPKMATTGVEQPTRS
jgi:hypothetical protein